jgi:hypothetical protein
VIAHFAALEADFQREYRINLAAEVWLMSWRRFANLLRDLSPESTWKRIAAAKIKPGVRRLEDPQEIEDFVSSLATKKRAAS